MLASSMAADSTPSILRAPAKKMRSPSGGRFFLSATPWAELRSVGEAGVDREFANQSHAQMLASSMAADSTSSIPRADISFARLVFILCILFAGSLTTER